MANLRVPQAQVFSPSQQQNDAAGPGTASHGAGYPNCPLARGLNQSAAFCDTVAARLNDVLSTVDRDEVGDRENDIDALVRGMAIDEETSMEGSRGIPKDKKQRHRRIDAPSHERHASGSGGSTLINFKKTWQYANSRLPPHLLPFKVYLPTWQILSRAAEASQAVYRQPQRNEQQDFVDADWRQGTKAMVLKTVLMDEKKLIVFAIRGSKWNFVDWAVNFRPAPTEPVGFLDDEGNACHAGFLSVAKAMVRPVAAHLREILEQDPSRTTSSLVITGHSAGGAVASMLFMHMLSSTVSSELNTLTGCFRRVHCIAFGSPPISLLPLEKPGGNRNAKNLFYSIVNEGDPVVRADKQYIYSLGRLIAAPSPDTDVSQPSLAHGLRQKVSRQRLRGTEPSQTRTSSPLPIWPVPDSTLSNAGRLVLLRKKPGQKATIEAVGVDDQQLRDRIFGECWCALKLCERVSDATEVIPC